MTRAIVAAHPGNRARRLGGAWASEWL